MSGKWWVISGASVVIFLAGWGWLHLAKEAKASAEHPVLRRENRPENIRAIDSAIQLLHDGDLALRTGADATSVMLRQMNQHNKAYSHCGIVFIEKGQPFVYHSIGGEDNPDAALRRDPASVFFSPKGNERMGIARLQLTNAEIQRLHGIVQAFWRARIPFDMDFDLKTNNRLYCAEFVYKAVTEATQDSSYFSVSKLLDKVYVGVDDLYAPRHARLICDVHYKP